MRSKDDIIKDEECPLDISIPQEEEAIVDMDSDSPSVATADTAEAEPVVGDDEIPVAKTAEDEAQETDEPRRSAWKLFSSEDLPQVSLREILGGDYLVASFLRQNILFIVFLLGLGVAYITNRYLAQQEIIEADRLRTELVEKKNYALTQYALLTRSSRQSNIEAKLQEMGDTLLQVANEPPFIIRKKD